MAVTYLSKLDIDLQSLHLGIFRKRTVVNLYIDESIKNTDSNSLLGDYANSIILSNKEHLVYQFSHNYSILSIYPLKDTIDGKTVIIHFPDKSLNQNYTTTSNEIDGKINFDLILANGILLNISIPLDFIFTRTSKLTKWYKLLNPYDFSVRLPHYLYSVNKDYKVVFLNDGGLLGLKKRMVGLDDYELQPVLFNDNSYIQSFARFFSKNDFHYHNVVACTLFHETFLITLTQNCKLKIWNLRTSSMDVQHDFFENGKQNYRIYDMMGPYLSLFDNFLAVYLPFGSGEFQFFELVIKETQISLHLRQKINTNLSTSSIWSLVDIKLSKSLNLNFESTFLNLVILWKSNTVVKLQILNLRDKYSDSYEWIESNSVALVDLEDTCDILTTGNTEAALLNLKSRYSPLLYEEAQKILNENDILLGTDDSTSSQYLKNLESILKSLKKQFDEPCSLALYHDKMIMVNTMHLYNHSFYKINSTLENFYYGINDPLMDGQLENYLKIINGFASILSTDTMNKLSRNFLDVINHKIDKQLSLKEQLTQIFFTCIENQFQLGNLKKLFEELSTLDLIKIIDDLIVNYLQHPIQVDTTMIDSLSFDNFAGIVTLESVHYQIIIQKKLILQTLLIFTLLDFDHTIFHNQLDFLLKLHYNQSLWIRLYQLDKSLLLSEIFSATSKYGYGSKLIAYSDLSTYSSNISNYVSKLSSQNNPLFLSLYEKWILNNKSTDSTLILKFLIEPFFIRDNQLYEFMYGLALLKCGEYDDAYFFLSKYAYCEIISNSLPDFLKNIGQDSNHPWNKLLSSFDLPYKEIAYYFYLSCLFSGNMSYANALKCIKKSINISVKSMHDILPDTFKVLQLRQYLDVLIVFSEFKEVLEVLRIEQSTLSELIREEYYTLLLSDVKYSEKFTSTLFHICEDTKDGVFLSMEDFMIVDKVLMRRVDHSNWSTYKKIFAFRFLNLHKRTAAEVLYDYIMHGSDMHIKKKCYLIIINVLSTFKCDSDKWILAKTSKGNIITMKDLQEEIKAL